MCQALHVIDKKSDDISGNIQPNVKVRRCEGFESLEAQVFINTGKEALNKPE